MHLTEMVSLKITTQTPATITCNPYISTNVITEENKSPKNIVNANDVVRQSMPHLNEIHQMNVL